MKTKNIAIIAIAFVVVIAGAGLLLIRENLDPRARAIKEAKNYTPKGLCTAAETPARHTKSGATFTFTSGCIPPGWEAIRSTAN